uniref:C2H2-type domain-containing protein n=1 Tax=Timema monikensis TaxID=170555 RepID=A0A7R9ED33_9NEOP|nr:unnamed protein product [Timema monikensis]
MKCDWRSLDFESYLEHKETVQHRMKEKMETAMEEDIDGEEAVDDDCVDDNEDDCVDKNEDDFFCNLCNVDSTSRAEAEKHIKSAAHQNELKKHFELAKHSDNVMKTNLSCDSLCCKMCDVTKSTQSTFKQHLLSKVHIEMIVLRESIKAKTPLDGNKEPTAETKKIALKKTTSSLDTYCKTCDYVFPTNVAYKKHLQSQGHIDKLLQLQFKDSQSENSEKVQDGMPDNKESVECSLCKITFSSPSQFCTHLKSRFPVTHESEFQSDYDETKIKSLNLKAKPNIYICNPCNITFQSEYEHARHLVSKKHCDIEAYLKLQDLQPKLKSNAPKPAHLTPGYGKAIYRCSFCNIEYASNYEYNDHLLTPEHKKKQASFVRSSHVCKPCDISSNSEDEYRFHLASSSHKKNVEEIAEDNIQYLPNNLTTYECHYCALVCSSKNDYESHLLSNTHKMHMASLKVSLCTKFKCEICNLQFSTYQEFSSHQYSTKHRLTIEALERKQACHSVTLTSDHHQSYLHLDHSTLVTNSSVYDSIQSNVGATRSASGSFESFPHQGFSDRVTSSVYNLPHKPKDVYSMPQQQDITLVDTSPTYINRRNDSPLHKLENCTFRELDHLRVSECQQLVSGGEDLWERRAAPAENRDQKFSFRAERMLVHKGAQPLAQAQSTSAVVSSPQYVSFEEFSFSRERQALLEQARNQ